MSAVFSLLIGLFVGTVFGALMRAVLTVASDADDKSDDFWKEVEDDGEL